MPFEQRQKLFLEGPIGAALLRLAVPIILGNILQTGYQLTDAFWVGRLGGAAVAAVAVSFPVTFLVIALGAGLAVAGATLSAQYMGAGRQDMVNHVAAQTMTMVAVTSIVLGSVGYILSPYLLELIGVAPDVYHGALGFMRVSFIGILFVFLYAMFQALMRGVGETRMPLLIVLGTVILNFILDPLFIFGWQSLPPQGVMGAALATLVTQAIAALLGIIIFLHGRHGIQLAWADFRPDPNYIKRAFFLGLPGSIELSTRGLGPMLMTFLVTSFGTVTLAAYGIGSNILQFIIIPAMGLSMAVSTLVSQNIGAGNIQRAVRVTVLGAVWGFVILTLAGIVAYVFAPALVAFFVSGDAEVVAEGVRFIRVMCLVWGAIGVQLCIVSAFRASGNMLVAMVIAIVSQFMSGPNTSARRPRDHCHGLQAALWCQQYMSEVTLFIEPQAPSGRRLVAQYEEGSYKDAPEFAAGIPDDWTEKDILRFIDLPGSKTFPAWESPARVHGSAMLMWPNNLAGRR